MNIVKRKNVKISDERKAFEEALSRQRLAGRYVLMLFIAGTAPSSLRAIRNIRALCDKWLEGSYELRVIDIYQHPEQVRSEQIAVTPTLVRKAPSPKRRLFGDLSKLDQLLAGLDIVPLNAAL